MKQSGIDEAGLGPLLGPYCLGYTEFSCSEKKNLFETLSSSVSRNPDQERIAIGDSKKLYGPSKGISLIEESVLSLFYSVFESIPDSFHQLINKLTDSQFKENCKTIPWYVKEFDFPLPLSSDKKIIGEKGERFTLDLRKKGVSLDQLGLRFISAAELNRKLDQIGNKSFFCLNQVASFIKPETNQERVYYIDRQGGRTRYGDWLINAFPGSSLQAFEEGKIRSCYRLEQSEILFSVGSDDTYLETAAASLVAKYTRELAMKAFNEYWKKRVPDIKATAGYVTDGRRFVADLNAAKALPEDIDLLIRKK